METLLSPTPTSSWALEVSAGNSSPTSAPNINFHRAPHSDVRAGDINGDTHPFPLSSQPLAVKEDRNKEVEENGAERGALPMKHRRSMWTIYDSSSEEEDHTKWLLKRCRNSSPARVGEENNNGTRNPRREGSEVLPTLSSFSCK